MTETCGDYGGTNRDGEPCQRAAGWGTAFEDGKCRLHRGTSPDGSSHAGNTNAVKHGIYRDADDYYQDLEDYDQAFVDAIFRSFLEDAPFTEHNVGKCEKLWQVAIDLHKRRRANAQLSTEGLTTTVGYSEGGQPIQGEHYLHITYDRLGRETTRTLKELGVLDDPDSQQASAITELKEAWKERARSDASAESESASE